jgi:hypothetical protein
MKTELKQTAESKQEQPSVLELSDLQLALVGGGTTDVIFH